MSETKAYSPSPAAREHAVRETANYVNLRQAVRSGVDAAHDPALGLDGSICKRTVIERIQREADEYDDERDQILVRRVAEALVREWHRAR
jgi:hypothetical protein